MLAGNLNTTASEQNVPSYFSSVSWREELLKWCITYNLGEQWHYLGKQRLLEYLQLC